MSELEKFENILRIALFQAALLGVCLQMYSMYEYIIMGEQITATLPLF